ncbi:hypothetical protein PCAR4_200049 [Paraburkholderia caribensis]|nr:hypothetical protein PCAR4_200049 [Paraburkholderia caribensis]
MRSAESRGTDTTSMGCGKDTSAKCGCVLRAVAIPGEMSGVMVWRMEGEYVRNLKCGVLPHALHDVALRMR